MVSVGGIGGRDGEVIEVVTPASGRVRASLLALAGVILVQVATVALVELHNEPGPMEFRYLSKLFTAVQFLEPGSMRISVFMAIELLIRGVLLAVVATASTWIQYWVMLLATFWLPVGWRKVRWGLWGLFFAFAVLVAGSLVWSHGFGVQFVLEAVRSVLLLGMGWVALVRDRVVVGNLAALEWSVYLVPAGVMMVVAIVGMSRS